MASPAAAQEHEFSASCPCGIEQRRKIAKQPSKRHIAAFRQASGGKLCRLAHVNDTHMSACQQSPQIRGPQVLNAAALVGTAGWRGTFPWNVNRRLVFAHGAIAAACDLELIETHRQRVDHQEPAEQRLADPASNLTAPVACTVASMPGSTPNTPASAQHEKTFACATP